LIFTVTVRCGREVFVVLSVVGDAPATVSVPATSATAIATA
jgi:hypothetical protein